METTSLSSIIDSSHGNGIRLSFLRHFVESRKNLDVLTTEEVLQKIIKLETRKLRCSFCHLLLHPNLQSDIYAVGKANIYVSCDQGIKFLDAVRLLSQHFPENGHDDVILWWDIFSYNSHMDKSLQNHWFSKDLPWLIGEIGHIVLVSGTSDISQLLHQPWCLYTLYCSHITRKMKCKPKSQLGNYKIDLLWPEEQTKHWLVSLTSDHNNKKNHNNNDNTPPPSPLRSPQKQKDPWTKAMHEMTLNKPLFSSQHIIANMALLQMAQLCRDKLSQHLSNLSSSLSFSWAMEITHWPYAYLLAWWDIEQPPSSLSLSSSLALTQQQQAKEWLEDIYYTYLQHISSNSNSNSSLSIECNVNNNNNTSKLLLLPLLNMLAFLSLDEGDEKGGNTSTNVTLKKKQQQQQQQQTKKETTNYKEICLAWNKELLDSHAFEHDHKKHTTLSSSFPMMIRHSKLFYSFHTMNWETIKQVTLQLQQQRQYNRCFNNDNATMQELQKELSDCLALVDIYSQYGNIFEIENLFTVCDEIFKVLYPTTSSSPSYYDNEYVSTQLSLVLRQARFYHVTGQYSLAKEYFHQYKIIQKQMKHQTDEELEVVAIALQTYHYDISFPSPAADNKIPDLQSLLLKEDEITLSSLIELAIQYRLQHQYPLALYLSQEIYVFAKQTFGKIAPITLRALNNLGNVFYAQEDYNQAEKIHEECYTRRRENVGKWHSETLQSMHNLACVYLKQGNNRSEEAKQLLQECYEQRVGIYGETHVLTQHTKQQLDAIII